MGRAAQRPWDTGSGCNDLYPICQRVCAERRQEPGQLAQRQVWTRATLAEARRLLAVFTQVGCAAGGDELAFAPICLGGPGAPSHLQLRRLAAGDGRRLNRWRAVGSSGAAMS